MLAARRKISVTTRLAVHCPTRYQAPSTIGIIVAAVGVIVAAVGIIVAAIGVVVAAVRVIVPTFRLPRCRVSLQLLGPRCIVTHDVLRLRCGGLAAPCQRVHESAPLRFLSEQKVFVKVSHGTGVPLRCHMRRIDTQTVEPGGPAGIAAMIDHERSAGSHLDLRRHALAADQSGNLPRSLLPRRREGSRSGAPGRGIDQPHRHRACPDLSVTG